MKEMTKMDESIIDEYHSFVNDIFKDRDVFKKYWLDFFQLKDKEAQNTLMKVCQLIHFMKQLDSCNIPYHDSIDFIMITSIIELLQTTKYNKTSHCRDKFRRFFREYLNDNEKIRLLHSISVAKGNRYRPFCFRGDECVSQYNNETCKFEFGEDCPIKNNEGMKESLDGICNFLYNIRSQFVHSGRLPIFSSPEKSPILIHDVYDYYIINGTEYRVGISLSVKFLYDTIVKNFQTMLDKYLEHYRNTPNPP